MKSKVENNILTVYADERIDAHNYEEVQAEISELMENGNDAVILDCQSLTYIASAGLRVLLSVGKKASSFSLINVNRDVYEILQMTGFTNMFDTKRLMREISVDGCKIVGAGLSSDVYRIDRETVVKLFAPTVALDRIYRETATAKKAFVVGIPTAIPYDIVKSNGRYGTVFELIDAVTLSQHFMDHPELFDDDMEKYTKLLKNFHKTKAPEGAFPKIQDKFTAWAEGLRRFMEDGEIELIKKMIDAVPKRDTMVHVDCHSRNIMVQNGQLIFVDMGDVSEGHPLFDIGAEYFHYVIFKETSLGVKTIFGAEPEDKDLPVKVWNDLVRRYFAGSSDEEYAIIHKMLKYFGCLRCLIMVAKHAHISNETAMELINRQRRDLLPYADEAIELFKKADLYFRKD